jgi:hypothetical protein
VTAPETPARTVGPVTAAGAAGTAAAVIIVYIAGLFGLEVPQLVAGALGLLLTIAGGYLVKPPGRHE